MMSSSTLTATLFDPIRLKALQTHRIALSEKIVITPGINDNPRNPNSLNFRARQIAAHRQGLWLTDELNAKIVLPGSHFREHTSAIQTARPAEAPCYSCGNPFQQDPDEGDTPGNYGYGAYMTLASGDINDDGSDSSDDNDEIQANYSGGTSSLFGEYVDGSGTNWLIDFESDGDVIGMANNPSATAPPASQDDSIGVYGDAFFLYQNACQLQGGTLTCASDQFFNLIPKSWFCAVLGGSSGVGAKYGAGQKGVGEPANSLIGVIIGVSVAQFCGSL